MDKYTLYVGLDSLYIAPILQDDAYGYVTGTPEPLAPVAERDIQEQQNVMLVYHDMGVQDARSLSYESLVSLEVPVLPARLYGLITGDINCRTTGMIYDTGTGKVPMFALGYREQLSGGHYRYVWHQKGYFTKPNTTVRTMEDGLQAEGMRLGYVSIPTVHTFHATGLPQKSVKADTCDCGILFDQFFDSVVTPDNMLETVCMSPEIIPSSGTTITASNAEIYMLTKDNGDTIIYTTDGSEPLDGAGNVYTDPISVDEV